MKIKLTLGLLLLSVTFASCANDLDPLWIRSSEKMLSNGLWIPEKVRICEEVIDQTGDLQASGCYDFKILRDSKMDNLSIRQMESVETKDQAESDSSMINLLQNLGLGIPYFIEAENLTISPLAEKRAMAGEACIGFAFEAVRNDHNFSGTVWIGSKSATPKLIEMRLNEEDPIKFKGAEIDHFYRTIEFVEDGVIRPSRVTAEAWVSNRSLFKKSLVVRKFTADLQSHWKMK